VTPFSGSKLWYPVFAVRPLLLQRIEPNWSTRWHRHWHYIAERQNLRHLLAHAEPAAVIAIDPLSAKAALEARAATNSRVSVALATCFTTSQAVELRDQGELTDDRTARAIWDLEREVIEHVDVVIHNSEWQRESLEVTRGLHPKRSVVVWHGIPEVVETTQLERPELGLGPYDVVLINVGSLEPRKNQLALLDLFAALRRGDARVKLLLVGDGPLRPAIESKIRRLDLTSRVKVLGAAPDVPALLNLSDLYVHYSKAESFGLVLLEAARASLPIAAVPVGGAGEVQRELGGLALPADDAAGGAALLGPLIMNKGLRAERGRHAHERFGAMFTVNRMAQGHLAALESRSSA